MRANWKVLGLIALLVCVAAPSRAQQSKLDRARDQFERAVALRTELESRPMAERSLAQYKLTIAAYKKVYAISPQAEEVTPSYVAAAELYREMALAYDESFFQSAIDTYNFLIKQYGHSRYAASSLVAIAKIQQDDLKDPFAAEATYKNVLKLYPKSPKSADAKEALAALAEVRYAQAHPPAPAAQPAEQDAADRSALPPPPYSAQWDPKEGGSEGGVARVSAVRTFNAENYTRVVIELGNTVRFEAGRIRDPDRIYFDLYQAALDPALAKKTFNVDNGFLKSVRVAQNKAGVVRLVLDVETAKVYSAYLLQNPFRLVIDVHGDTHSQTAAATKRTGPRAVPEPAESKPVPGPKPLASKPAGLDASSNASGDGTVVAENTGPAPVDRLPIRTLHGNAPAIVATPEPKTMRDGQRSLTRALGLKINRIVIDPGHGGHDTGTVGPHGLMEKDLCLDVALRLGKLIQERLPGADVVYTRTDDTFIPLEERTAIANQVKADLFISIHANSSHDHAARGVETYYLNFATSQDAMDVATRENALSQSSLHDLQDMIKKIARNDKIEESKEFADDIQDALSKRLQQVSQSERNRGVKKAPFVVLIGADMPSVLSEISFLSNAADEKMLKKPDQRQRVAEGLFRGVSSYLDSLNSLSYNRQKPAAPRADLEAEPDGNQK
ncbi:MAG: N-acetylmuramoyl-L-alanine amidase [Candidatus Acidiferrales bacterium]